MSGGALGGVEATRQLLQDADQDLADIQHDRRVRNTRADGFKPLRD